MQIRVGTLRFSHGKNLVPISWSDAAAKTRTEKWRKRYMCMHSRELAGKWALILGASSGFGAATARALAGRGMNIFGVHMDRKSTMPMVEELIADLKNTGVQVQFFNFNAADPERRQLVLADIRETVGAEGGVRVLMHSLAFGAFAPFIAEGNTA